MDSPSSDISSGQDDHGLPVQNGPGHFRVHLVQEQDGTVVFQPLGNPLSDPSERAPAQCATCDEVYPNPHQLQQHASAVGHIGWYCNCGKKFARDSTIRRHLRERPYCPCQYEGCEEVFVDSAQLENHIQTEHEQSAPAQHPTLAGDAAFHANPPAPQWDHQSASNPSPSQVIGSTRSPAIASGSVPASAPAFGLVPGPGFWRPTGLEHHPPGDVNTPSYANLLPPQSAALPAPNSVASWSARQVAAPPGCMILLPPYPAALTTHNLNFLSSARPESAPVYHSGIPQDHQPATHIGPPPGQHAWSVPPSSAPMSSLSPVSHRPAGFASAPALNAAYHVQAQARPYPAVNASQYSRHSAPPFYPDSVSSQFLRPASNPTNPRNVPVLDLPMQTSSNPAVHGMPLQQQFVPRLYQSLPVMHFQESAPAASNGPQTPLDGSWAPANHSASSNHS